MASAFRTAFRRFSTIRGGSRWRPAVFSRAVLMGSAAVAGGAFALTRTELDLKTVGFPVVSAAAAPTQQESVISGTKEHALYLWIYLKPNADKKKCAKIVANLESMIDSVSPPADKDETDEIWGGVGFGPNFYSQVTGKKTEKNYNYPHRKGDLGDMPSSGGDIFIHAKSNTYSKLFELSQKIIGQLPADSVESFEDVYGWVYQNGRDLSGFVDGTENPADDEHRASVAIEPQTGGSYVITQKWIHDHKYLKSAPNKVLEAAVGRTRPDSTELSRKPIQSHVARMTGGNNFEQAKAFEMVRQSQPYGTVSGDSGLFFIGYAASPANFEFMLDRMVAAGGDGHNDLIMSFTKCVKGTYWYFPGKEELKSM